ncbi:uncharacterized protein LOC131232943 [Magnolia sinica]|uniref:uncharacterized protein LOC131232943 n=1 Tax=Magnolia sinica TaxID=86752 RepID=UPI002658FA3C|nr:uncharacterized protein LOC131232943 [Magnolia sinica]
MFLLFFFLFSDFHLVNLFLDLLMRFWRLCFRSGCCPCLRNLCSSTRCHTKYMHPSLVHETLNILLKMQVMIMKELTRMGNSSWNPFGDQIFGCCSKVMEKGISTFSGAKLESVASSKRGYTCWDSVQCTPHQIPCALLRHAGYLHHSRG